MVLLTLVAAVPLVPAAAVDAASQPITENSLAMYAAAIVGTAAITATVTIFLTNRLSKNRGLAYDLSGGNRRLTYQVRDQILEAIRTQGAEFRRWMIRHERGDDDRFDLLHREVYGLHLRNSIKDRKTPPVFESLPRRRPFDDKDEVDDPMKYASDVKRAGMTPMMSPDDLPHRTDSILPDDKIGDG